MCCNFVVEPKVGVDDRKFSSLLIAVKSGMERTWGVLTELLLLHPPVHQLVHNRLHTCRRYAMALTIFPAIVDHSSLVCDQTWLNDNIPVPSEVYRTFAKYIFQQNLLVKNRTALGQYIVDLRKINLPTTEPDGSQRRPRSVVPHRAAGQPGQFHRQGKDHLASRAHGLAVSGRGSKRAVAAGR
jgi:hypothetical protein